MLRLQNQILICHFSSSPQLCTKPNGERAQGSKKAANFYIWAMSEEGADALFIDDSPELITKAQLIGDLVKKYRLPAIYPFRSYVEDGGGLMSSATANVRSVG